MSTALVLSGGGARGAYEAGVVAGLVDVLGAARFTMIAGTSVGAINAAFLAGHAHLDDLQIHRLVDLWTSLSLRTHLKLGRRPLRWRAALDVRPFERLVRDSVDWRVLQDNIDSGVLEGLFVAALEVSTGRTAVFADLAPSVDWKPSRDPRRLPMPTRIGPEHVLASAAIPGIFPARRVGRSLYYDGGLRFNTPISPVLRTGCTRLVVVSPLHAEAQPPEPSEAHEVDALFLVGKLLHAVLLDPFAYDLQVLDRFNSLLDVLDDTMTEAEKRAFDEHCIEVRGSPYRKVEAMVFSPTEDIGRLALTWLVEHRRRLLRQGLWGLLLAVSARRLLRSETDLASYLMFDGAFTEMLIELGRNDVRNRADEVRAFFADR